MKIVHLVGFVLAFYAVCSDVKLFERDRRKFYSETKLIFDFDPIIL